MTEAGREMSAPSPVNRDRVPQEPAITVELLYFDGCPNYETLLPRMHELVARAGVTAEVELRRVESDEEAQRQRFLGSPSVRVGGRDIERDADTRKDFGLKCRLYRADSGTSGVPPDSWVLAALREQASPEDSQG